MLYKFLMSINRDNGEYMVNCQNTVVVVVGGGGGSSNSNGTIIIICHLANCLLAPPQLSYFCLCVSWAPNMIALYQYTHPVPYIPFKGVPNIVRIAETDWGAWEVTAGTIHWPWSKLTLLLVRLCTLYFHLQLLGVCATTKSQHFQSSFVCLSTQWLPSWPQILIIGVVLPRVSGILPWLALDLPILVKLCSFLLIEPLPFKCFTIM